MLLLNQFMFPPYVAYFMFLGILIENELLMTQLSHYFGFEWILQEFDRSMHMKLSHFWATLPIFWTIVKIFQDTKPREF